MLDVLGFSPPPGTPSIQDGGESYPPWRFIRWIFSIAVFVFEGFLSSHSFTLTTVHPARFSWAETRLSRRRFFATFSFQNAALCCGSTLHRQPCQKHPSTKTASIDFLKTKSGLPGSLRSFIFQPEIPQHTKCALSRFSVVFPCRDPINDMIRERVFEDTRSIPLGL